MVVPPTGTPTGDANPIRRDYFVDAKRRHAFNVAYLNRISRLQKEVVAKYLRPENTQRFRHGGDWSHPGLPNASGGEMKEHSAEVETKFDDLVDHNLDEFERLERRLLDEMERQFAETLFSTVSSACEQTGNTVDAKAAGSLEEAFFQTIEKIEFSADSKEVVSLPEMHMHPDMAKRMVAALEAAPQEFKERLESLKDRKTAEAIAREKERKAKFVCYKTGE